MTHKTDTNIFPIRKKAGFTLSENIDKRINNLGGTWLGVSMLELDDSEPNLAYAGNGYLNALDYIIVLEKMIVAMQMSIDILHERIKNIDNV